jgi:hydrogenase maturation factor
MHDPTEGGLATGLRELAGASGVGLRVHREHIPILEAGAALCTAFGLDPLGAIASGSLLLTVPPERVPELLSRYQQAGIPCAEIGEILPAERGITLVEAVGERELPWFPRDEIARLFEEA